MVATVMIEPILFWRSSLCVLLRRRKVVVLLLVGEAGGGTYRTPFMFDGNIRFEQGSSLPSRLSLTFQETFVPFFVLGVLLLGPGTAAQAISRIVPRGGRGSGSTGRIGSRIRSCSSSRRGAGGGA